MAGIERQVDDLQDKVDQLQRQFDELVKKVADRIAQIEIKTGGYTTRF